MATCKSSPGSSPHTRGARDASLSQLAAARIIPAYAGSTPVSPTPARSRQDHPRIRGEHALHRDGVDVHSGIIPAYAGSTSPLTDTQTAPAGSSPHTRGAPPLGRCYG